MRDPICAAGPAPDGDDLSLFGQFVGDWVFDMVNHTPSGPQTATGEWSFRWVLEGRAIEDVWMVPTAAERERGAPLAGFGATVRLYDPKSKAWRVSWNGVTAGVVYVFEARRIGDEIVLERHDAEAIERWIFSGVTPDSFAWRAVSSKDGGASWELQQEFAVRRRSAVAV